MGLLPEADSSRALLSLVLLVAGTVLCGMALRNVRWEVLGAAVASAGLVGWSLTGDDYDGPVLFVVVQGHGLHLGDLLSLPALLLVLWLSWRRVRH